MRSMLRRHHQQAGRGQRGASLILVLTLVAFLGIIVPALLGMALTGSRATEPVVEDRKELYAASSAIDAAVQLGVEDTDVGVPGGPCPESVTNIDGFEVTVTCEQHDQPDDGCRYLDRFVTFTAEARKISGGGVPGTMYADVVYRFSTSGDPTVEVRRWTSDGDVASTLSTTTLPSCGATTTTAPTTTTTSTTTTTTTTVPGPTTTTSTTTTAPAGSAFTLWEDVQSAERQGNRWRAEGTVLVTDQNGAPLNGARVAVQFRYRTTGSSTWVGAGSIAFDTTVTGRATVYSPEYRNNQNVAEIEMTITALTEVGGRTWVSTAHPLTVLVPRS
jgi:hypothetical protein